MTMRLTRERNQQATLLDSLTLTNTSLSALPATSTITPILTQLPHYEQKLARLKSQMTQATHQMESLKRRSEAAKVRRGRNLERIREVRGREREADRTVLRARVVVVREEGTPERGGSPVSLREGSAGGSPVGSFVETTTTDTVGVVKKITRKKKARQARID